MFTLPKTTAVLRPAALVASIAIALTACNDHDDGNAIHKDKSYEAIDITFAHINDHHSHLEPEGDQEFQLNGTTYEVERGGFARITQLYQDLESQYGNGNFLKLHAGDALTGTPYYSFYKGKADADMMNTVCFDAFALGNHEFDDGDQQLAEFIDYLNSGSCQTPVLAANVKPAVGTPLAPNAVDDYIKPYIIKETKEGVKVGIIGLDIASKTTASSRPLDTTEFLDETTTAQNYINELQGMGIEHIVLLTHYTYENDQTLAKNLTGVDVILGGDSHTLLGDFNKYGSDFGSQGAYPTVTTNKNGETVCIGQAWEYTKALGLMNVSFNKQGSVDSCTGSAIIPVAQTFKAYNPESETNDDADEFIALTDADNTTLLNTLLAEVTALNQGLGADILYPIKPNESAAATLANYTSQFEEQMAKVIGTTSDTLCLVRVPGTTRSADVSGCETSATKAQGSDIAQVVAESFLYASLEADIALQNAGGVRITVPAGNITNKVAYELLPFSNTLVDFTITGQQIIDTLEEGIANHMDNDGSSGSHPYTAGLRWDLDMTKTKGSRISNVEVRDRKTGTWSDIDLTKEYIMVTNNYIGGGKDGYTTLGQLTDAGKVTDTKLLYTQSFIDYVTAKGTISRVDRDDYSHKTVITAEGNMLEAY